MRRFVTAVLVAAVVLTMTGIMLAGDAPDAAPRAQQVDPLVRVLQAKGVLTAQEAQALAAVPLSEQRDQLTSILLKKGVITATDLQGASTISNERLVAAYSTSASVKPAVAVETEATPAMPQAAAAPKPPPVIPASAPIRVLPLDSPKRDALVPTFKIGPVKATPYGYMKMSVVEDSSSPYAIDFELPGLIVDSGPDAAPEFKISARNTRLGGNFEWLDPSNKLSVTGKIEFDFEGNYTSVANRGISSLRSSMPSLRLAFGRLDYAASPKTTVFAVFGQDWTPFGSSTLPNSIETTGLGIGFGSLYERAQQVRGGFSYSFGGNRNAKLLMEAAMVQPSSGNQPFPYPGNSSFQIPGTIPANTTTTSSNVFLVCPAASFPCTSTNATGVVAIPQTPNAGQGIALEDYIGERQGSDSNRPSVEGRFALQFQLDKAPGVAPAQIIISGQHGKRDALLTSALIPNAPLALGSGFYKTAFPKGARTSSDTWGFNPQIQLPTRYATLIASYYRGGDLRWFFAGQVLSFYNDTTGLTNVVTAPNIDGSSAVAFGTSAGTAVFAPERPIRTQGGFLELGLPLSRIGHANPTGRNAGWSMNLHYGLDDVNDKDLRHLTTGSFRDRSDWAFANLFYKLNNWVTFAFEESYYRTRAYRSASAACAATPNIANCYPNTLFRGNPARSWHDVREQFATIFTF